MIRRSGVERVRSSARPQAEAGEGALGILGHEKAGQRVGGELRLFRMSY